MAGFADLVSQAQPALFGGGFNVAATAGRTWKWRLYDINDSAGDPINLTAVTGTFTVVNSRGGSTVLALTFTGGIGEFTVSATKAATAGLFSGGNDQTGRKCYWYGTLDDGTNSVQTWLVDNSEFTIRRGA